MKEYTLDELYAKLEDGSLTSEGLVKAYLERIYTYDPNLRSIGEINPLVLVEARLADAERKKSGARSRLHGIPIVLKDNINTHDHMHTSAGSKALEDVYAPYDATVTQKLRDAGMVLLGKANLSEFAYFMSTEMPCGFSSRFGQVVSPYDSRIDPLGSSTGSAVAVAANLIPVSIGTETNGSLMSPAMANCICSIKPTLGMVSRYGILPITGRQDTAGPMARTVQDCARLMDVLYGWRMGYGIVSVVQLVLSLLLFLSLPLWKKNPTGAQGTVQEAPIGLREAVAIRGVKSILTAFFCYCSFESISGLWATSYLVTYKNVAPETAAFFAAMFFSGITAGRLLSGFVCNRIGDKNMVRIGIIVIALGIVLIALPVETVTFALVGLVVIGIGAAPIYPSILHATPDHFGKENAHAIVGIQMASAYSGSTLMPPVFGLVAQHLHIALYPLFMAVFILLLLVMTERVHRICAQPKAPV